MREMFGRESSHSAPRAIVNTSLFCTLFEQLPKMTRKDNGSMRVHSTSPAECLQPSSPPQLSARQQVQHQIDLGR